ncbi:Gfo/Idh/MocA family protein [Candidatus Pelagisphaera phototrophica]|uniref:Gfo/Idh/MocA family protein n=1 Tax=Candidatus Pelagisphaera phototrophica TaxID=2684113 RepID=UPI001A0493F5|nr:Gfo/Idh/MocA family oxidoreductase [Candidatus Pelagisphaera phototrophica]QXD32099.1 Gfo/Idh/MocA family oxidoreductase [Candidatus Pelagisphaera phototrophica]
MKSEDSSRRKFVKIIGASATGIVAGCTIAKKSETPSRRASAKYMGDFIAPKLDTVRCAFIGVGARGSGHNSQIAEIEGTEVVGISDLHEDLAKKAQSKSVAAGKGERHQNIKLYYENGDSWKQMLRERKPDMVVIATPWKLHAPMAIEAMKAGVHAFVEVPLALTNKEMWDIVDTSESTGRHCMMMENVNYGREELIYLNMCRQGVIGELLHAEASYIHELRGQMNSERSTGSWRTYHYANRDGNLYPTHGLGPVAQYMNLARGDDNFGRLVSYSTLGRGRSLYAKENFPADHKWNKIDFKGGDLNTSIIKTNLGRTVMVQWDETSPRPYSRHNLVQGTKGTLAGFPTRVALEGGVDGATDNHHKWAEGEQLEAIFAKYEHPLYKRLGELAKKMGGHGGMDFIMRYRMIECLRLGQPLDQNVYEGAFWSAVSPLSEKSVAEDGAPQVFPDFTRGEWKHTKPLDIVA